MLQPRSVDYLLTHRLLPDRDADFTAAAALSNANVDARKQDFRTLLANILGSELDRLGSRRILLPVTSGLDSRGLLGAALDVLPADAIQTFTIGEPSNQEVVGGRAAAERAGVAWEPIDPRTVEWDTDRIRSMIQRRQHSADSATPIMTSSVNFMDHAARRWPGGGLVSGHFGGPIAGGTVKPRDVIRREAPEWSIERFLLNASRSSYEHRVDGSQAAPRLRRYLSAWLSKLPAPNHLGPGASNYDLLNWHFRASRLLLPAFSAATNSWTAPYMTMEWMHYWFQQSPAQRFNRRKYRRELFKAYPKIFADLDTQEARAQHSILRKVARKAQRSLRRDLAVPSPAVTQALLSETGDPRTNESLRAHLTRCCEAFDARGLYTWLACDDLEGLLHEPTYGGRVRVQSVAMLEINMQAEALLPDGLPKL